MNDKDTLISDFGTWLNEEEANWFLDQLSIDSSRIEPNYFYLQKIAEAIITHLPFHNIFLLTRPPKAPSASEIRDDMLNLRGGPCGTMNTFLGALLRIKGFEVTLVSATIMEPHCHLGLLVSIHNNLYYVDAGDGKPYFDPMKIDEFKERRYTSHTYRSFKDGENFIIQYLSEDQKWNTTCSVHLTPRKFHFFEKSIHKHYTEESYGPFSRNLRLVKYPDRKILGFRNFTFLNEADNIYYREELPNLETLRLKAEMHFGLHKLPIQHAIDILVIKGGLING